jgi:hypothetical protein
VTSAKASIEALNKENNRLEKTRAATEKQWEDSMIAMSGRDKAIQNMQNSTQAVYMRLSDSNVTNRVYEAEQKSTIQKLSAKEEGLYCCITIRM